MTVGLFSCGGSSGPDARGPSTLFPERPECTGQPIAPGEGTQQLLLRSFAIAPLMQGLDLNADGVIDNKFGSLAAAAQANFDAGFADRTTILPLELFDMPTLAADPCVKIAMYTGTYVSDLDDDGFFAADPTNGDCNDHNAMIHPGAAEIAGNRIDDNCDGDTVGDDANVDADQDGFTIGNGDCDDTNALIGGTPGMETCGDGLDNDCDGSADYSGTNDACSPYDVTTTGETVRVDPSSYPGNVPGVRFVAGELLTAAEGVRLVAGPTRFTFAAYIGLPLPLEFEGVMVDAVVKASGISVQIESGIMGGVAGIRTADAITGFEFPMLGLSAENTLAEAAMGPLLGALLGLPLAPLEIRNKYNDCRTPDIDVDGDGLEAFCDSNPGDNALALDVCIDGDGTEIRDAPNEPCTQARLPNGTPRFADGISAAFRFTAAPVGNLTFP